MTTKFSILDKLLPEVYLLECPFFLDQRGSFAKIFHSNLFEESGLVFSPAETFLTTSSCNVLRGMHFQVGNAAHDKLVYCTAGSVLDVIVDVRPDSPEFNKPVSIILSSDKPFAIFIGKGYAHGFLSLNDNSSVLYSTSTVHAPSLDCGVLWSSLAFDWPVSKPILSERDRMHPSILSFQ